MPPESTSAEDIIRDFTPAECAAAELLCVYGTRNANDPKLEGPRGRCGFALLSRVAEKIGETPTADLLKACRAKLEARFQTNTVST